MYNEEFIMYNFEQDMKSFINQNDVKEALLKDDIQRVYEIRRLSSGAIPKLTEFFVKYCNIEPLNFFTYIPPYYAYATDLYTGKLVLPDIRGIKYEAFTRNINLEEVFVPESCDYLEEGIFNHCIGLRKITFAGKIKRLPTGIFAECTSLEEVHLPSSCVKFDKQVFPGTVIPIKVIYDNGIPDNLRIPSDEIEFYQKNIQIVE